METKEIKTRSELYADLLSRAQMLTQGSYKRSDRCVTVPAEYFNAMKSVVAEIHDLAVARMRYISAQSHKTS